MRCFHRRSIKQKLIILFTATAVATLVVAFILLWSYEWVNFRSTIRREMTTVANLLANSSTAAAAFEDARAAHETIATLRADRRVAAGCLVRNGRVLAFYARDSHTRSCPILPEGEYRFTASRLELSAPVLLGSEREGTIYLGVDLYEMYTHMALNAAAGLLVMLIGGLAALAISSRMQRVISGPILHLTDVAARVSAGDYGLRAKTDSEDELGDLIQRFNKMMDQIHNRGVALQQAQDELEMRVRERTSELRNEIAERKAVERDLMNAKVAAEESNRAKSAFLANMSHELRTPLNAIIGYSELLEEEAQDAGAEDTAKDLRRIQSSARHLLTLITDVLDLSKIEAGRIDLHVEPVAISDLIAEAAETVRPLASKNRNRFVVDDAAAEGVVAVDAMKFRQSLLNLLSNACKFTEDGEVTLSVKRDSAGRGEWVRWEVRDTGIGIAPENMGKLFQSFSQVDSSTTRKYGGTGLGLAISQRFCEMMGGHITVDSQPGRGSTFTIHIPAGSKTDA